METTKKSIFKPVDELVRLMKESKKQSEIESKEMYHTPEFQEFLKKLRTLKSNKK